MTRFDQNNDSNNVNLKQMKVMFDHYREQMQRQKKYLRILGKVFIVIGVLLYVVPLNFDHADSPIYNIGPFLFAFFGLVIYFTGNFSVWILEKRLKGQESLFKKINDAGK